MTLFDSHLAVAQKTGTNMEPWQVETWTKIRVCPSCLIMSHPKMYIPHAGQWCCSLHVLRVAHHARLLTKELAAAVAAGTWGAALGGAKGMTENQNGYGSKP